MKSLRLRFELKNLQNYLARYLGTAALMLASNAAPAIAAPAQVEVIVFSYKENIVNDDEWFARRFEKINVERPSLSELENKPKPSESTQDKNRNTDHPYPVPPTQLNNIAERIDKHPDMELLTHLSWVQEPNPKSITRPVYLDVEFDNSAIFSDLILSGTAMLYEVQLLLQFEIDATLKSQPDEVTDTAYYSQPVSLIETGPSYRIFERRRVQIDETHYLDHPKFGVIFTVVRP